MGKSSRDRQQEYRQRLKNSGKKQLLVAVGPEVHAALLNRATINSSSLSHAVQDTLHEALLMQKKKTPSGKKKSSVNKAHLDDLSRDISLRYKDDLVMSYAKMAIAYLESIDKNHPDREKALHHVQQWIKNNIEE